MTALQDMTWYIGINFFDLPRMNRRFAFLFLTLFSAILALMYSILLEYPDVKKMMEATMAMSIGAQIMLRFALYLLYPQNLPEIHETLLKFYRDLDDSDERRQQLLATHIGRIRFVMKFLLVIHAFCQFAPIFWSFMIFFFQNRYVYPLPIYLPFVERYSSIGFVVNCSFQIFLNVMLYMGNPATDTGYFLLLTQLKIEIDIFQCSIEDLSKCLLSYQFKTLEEQKIIDDTLIRIIDDHRKITYFHDLLESILNKQFFVLIAMNVYVICASGVSLITSEFTVAIGIAILYPIQIFIVCALGTFVCHQQDRMEAILWKLEWYKLKPIDQKKFLFFMLNVQQGLSLEPLFIGVINMELFTTVSFLRHFKSSSISF